MRLFRERLAGMVLVCGLALTLTACGSDTDTDPAPAPTADSDTTNAADDADQAIAGALSAIALAESEVGGTAFEIDEEGRSGWSIDVVAGDDVTEVYVDGDGTQVSRTESERRIDGEYRTRLDAAEVSLSEAIETAYAEVRGQLEGGDLDEIRGGTVVWSVIFEDGRDEVEVYIHAVNGDVVSVERD